AAGVVQVQVQASGAVVHGHGHARADDAHATGTGGGPGAVGHVFAGHLADEAGGGLLVAAATAAPVDDPRWRPVGRGLAGRGAGGDHAGQRCDQQGRKGAGCVALVHWTSSRWWFDHAATAARAFVSPPRPAAWTYRCGFPAGGTRPAPPRTSTTHRRRGGSCPGPRRSRWPRPSAASSRW